MEDYISRFLTSLDTSHQRSVMEMF